MKHAAQYSCGLVLFFFFSKSLNKHCLRAQRRHNKRKHTFPFSFAFPPEILADNFSITSSEFSLLYCALSLCVFVGTIYALFNKEKLLPHHTTVVSVNSVCLSLHIPYTLLYIEFYENETNCRQRINMM